MSNFDGFYASFGPLETYMRDPDIYKIMVNGFDSAFVDRGVSIDKVASGFENNVELMEWIEQFLVPMGRLANESHPIIDIRLAEGSRMTIVIPPIALLGPSFVIYKFQEQWLTMEDLIEINAISQAAADFLIACVRGGQTIISCGGTTASKITLLNILAGFYREGTRVIGLQDVAELQLTQPNLVMMETRPANLEGKGEISMRLLVETALKMNPHRLVINEIQGVEAWPLLQALSSGVRALFGIEANSPRDVLARLELMALTAEPAVPLRAIRETISAGVNLILQTELMRDGYRRVVRVSEIAGLQGDSINLQDVFHYVETGMEDGRIIGGLQPTGIIPVCAETIRLAGVELDDALFSLK